MSTLHLPPVDLRARDQLVAAATVLLAAGALVLALLGQYDPGAVVAFLGVVTGGYSQLVSESTAERFETVTATLCAAVVLAACLAFGSGLPAY
jgi:hypothetical protein